MAGRSLLRDGAGYALPLFLALAAIAIWAATTYGRQAYDLDRSAIGFDGLAAWLSRSGLEARVFAGGDRLTRERVGLRIYPLFAVAAGGIADTGDGGTPLHDLPRVGAGVVAKKRATAPTLVVLPKWRHEVAELGVVHPKLLLPANGVAAAARAVAAAAGALLPRGQGFSDIEAGGRAARLYAAQLIRAGSCEPLIGDRMAMLLGRCRDGVVDYWLLADPDLLDNHGLTRADNAAIAAALLAKIAGGRPIVVDLTTTAEPDLSVREARSWSDLLRFLAPPFTAAWAALLALLGLVLWRASLRLGPIAAADDGGWRAARAVSIDARARLLRRAGKDAELVRAYAADRLQSLAEELFGRYRAGDAAAEVERLVATRPALVAAYRRAFGPAAWGAAAAGEDALLRRAGEIAATRERIIDEFKRAAEPGRTHPG